MSIQKKVIVSFAVVAVVLGGIFVFEAAAKPQSSTTSPTSAPAPEQKKIELWQSVVLGIVQGITEFLPVSSTGHLIISGELMGLGGGKFEKSPAVDTFDIVIQLGSILAVLGLYRKRAGQICLGVVGKSPQGLRLAGLLLTAFMPAAVIGLLSEKWIKEHLYGVWPVICAFAVGGVLMIVVEHFFWTRRKDAKKTSSLDDVQYYQALVVGFAQCLAMWPGTSRSMITILAALVVGMNMVTAAEFSFLLALPTLGAATLYEGYKDRHELLQSAGIDGLLIGLIVSGIVAAIVIKIFVKWLTKHGLMPFGVYRILLAVAIYFLYIKH